MFNKNIVKQEFSVTRKKRELINNHKSFVLWFTGLSGSGKTRLARAIEEKLHKIHCHTIILDGDNVRHGLCSDLGFRDEDRKENLRRIGEVSKLFVEAGIITLVSFISPFSTDRNTVRNLFSDGDFVEIFVDCPIEVCENRDVKGLYKKARHGKIKNFTGISSPYEVPINPELVVHTDNTKIDDAAKLVVDFIVKQGLIKV